MSHNVKEFYDGLASRYHLLFADWYASVERQGEVLDRLIQESVGPGGKRILDCSCGIGTQAIGLALRGHAVTAVDISRQAVARASVEAERFGVDVEFKVCDMRRLEGCVPSGFEVAISCDNSLPHLLSVEDVARAVSSIGARLTHDGIFVASIRDYDGILQERPSATPIGLSTIEGRRRLVFQVWTWFDDGRTYEFEQFVGEEANGEWELRSARSKYRAITREELGAVLTTNGFDSPRWIMPGESGFYQPVVLSRKEG